MSEIQLRTTQTERDGRCLNDGCTHRACRADSDIETLLAALQSATAENERLRGLVEDGYQLSTYAACIKWDGSRNTTQWLRDLRGKIERFQADYKAAALSRTQEGVGDGKQCRVCGGRGELTAPEGNVHPCPACKHLYEEQ